MFCVILTKFGFSWHIFMKVPSIKFNVNLSSGSHVDTCWPWLGGQTYNTMKLTGTFCNYVNMPNSVLNQRETNTYECIYENVKSWTREYLYYRKIIWKATWWCCVLIEHRRQVKMQRLQTCNHVKHSSVRAMRSRDDHR
jgi:hypothetical protein